MPHVLARQPPPLTAVRRGRSRRDALAGGMLALLLMVIAGTVAAIDQVPWDGSLPAGALEAGQDGAGALLYVCIASGWGGQHPGALDSGGVCHVAWGGQEHTFAAEFSVLVDGTGAWLRMPEGGIPGGAVAAGRDDSGPIFVCRVAALGGLFPGKLTEDKWCYVATDGEEHYFTNDYEVLVE